jgi:hypothetical protein
MNNIFGQPIQEPDYDYYDSRQAPVYGGGRQSNRKEHHQCNDHNEHYESGCPQLPGTLIRINIPAGTTINILNLFEITSPSGICLIVRLPFLAGQCGTDPMNLINNLRQSGATVEFING